MRSASSFAPAPNAWMPGGQLNMSAAGSTQAGATAIPAGQDISVFTTVGSGQGCVLPGSGVSAFETYNVANHGANALLIYPAGTGKIGTLGASAGYSLAAGSSISLMFLGPSVNGNWSVGV